MSTKSKTGAKLVDSIRKSKTGTVASKTSNTREGASKPKASPPKTERREPEVQRDGRIFSRGRRVWPD